MGHLTKGLELLQTLPDTTERVQQELALQLALSGPLMASKGIGVPEVEKVRTRAVNWPAGRGDASALLHAVALVLFNFNRAELRAAHELAEQMMRVAQSVQDQYRLSYAHMTLGWT